MTSDKRITCKEAAGLLGYNVDYFRRTFLDPEHPIVGVCSLPAVPGSKRRRLLVLEADILKLIKPE
jgi:hypothetical protein